MCSQDALRAELQGLQATNAALGDDITKLKALWGLWDPASFRPRAPKVHITGACVVVQVSGTTPAPDVMAVDSVRVQQGSEDGPVFRSVPTDRDVSFPRLGPAEKIRLQWEVAGVLGPWSSWTHAVS